MSDEQSTEARIEEFLELERELEPKGADVATGVYEDGLVAGAERVPATDVPGDYPVPIGSGQALRLDVETADGIVETYVEWAPHGDGQGHVERLLDALGRGPDEFADVFGDRVALDYRDGYHTIDPEGTARLHGGGTDSTDTLLGLAYDSRYSGHAVAALVVAVGVGALAFGLEDGPGTLESLAVFGSLVLPLAIAYDCERITDMTDWDPTVVAWAAGALVPFVNVPLATAYLLRRREKLRQPGDGWATWATAVLVVGLASVGVPALLALSITGPVVPLYVFVVVLLPLAVYYDAESIDPDRTLGRVAWTAGTAILSLFFVGVVAAGVYLYVQQQ